MYGGAFLCILPIFLQCCCFGVAVAVGVDVVGGVGLLNMSRSLLLSIEVSIVLLHRCSSAKMRELLSVSQPPPVAVTLVRLSLKGKRARCLGVSTQPPRGNMKHNMCGAWAYPHPLPRRGNTEQINLSISALSTSALSCVLPPQTFNSTCRAIFLPCASARRHRWGRSFWELGLR